VSAIIISLTHQGCSSFSGVGSSLTSVFTGTSIFTHTSASFFTRAGASFFKYSGASLFMLELPSRMTMLRERAGGTW
jgi:hypothetical protein